MNVGGVVVVYNPCSLDMLLANVATYADFVSRLFVVDNSDEPNSELIRRLPQNCEYHSMNGNVGIAEALNFGMERCRNSRCEWVLTMDQDTAFDSGLEGYSRAIEKTDRKNVAVLAPSILGDSESSGMVEVEKVIQSGALINLKAFGEVGRFRNDYFIDYVDYEFCKRAASIHGFKIFVLSDVIIRHANGDHFTGSFCGWRYKYKFSSPIRMYYQMRNGLDYVMRYRDWGQMSILMKLIGKTILVAGEKRLRFRYLYRGFQDYRKNRFGKYGSR